MANDRETEPTAISYMRKKPLELESSVANYYRTIADLHRTRGGNSEQCQLRREFQTEEERLERQEELSVRLRPGTHRTQAHRDVDADVRDAGRASKQPQRAGARQR